MNIKEILAKVAKKEELTQEELDFLAAYDPQKDIDTASAAARRDGEKKAKDAVAKQTELQKQIDDLKTQLEAKEQEGKTGSEQLEKLAKKIKTLEEKNAASEAKLAASERLESIREAAKAAGVVPAEGISAKSMESLLDAAFGDTKMDDEDAVKAVLDQFKKDNPAMIRAEVKGGSKIKGGQQDNMFAGKPNPWKDESRNLTLQIQIEKSNPELAKTMKAEAGVPVE